MDSPELSMVIGLSDCEVKKELVVCSLFVFLSSCGDRHVDCNGGITQSALVIAGY